MVLHEFSAYHDHLNALCTITTPKASQSFEQIKLMASFSLQKQVAQIKGVNKTSKYLTKLKRVRYNCIYMLTD